MATESRLRKQESGDKREGSRESRSRPNAFRKGCWTCRRHHRKCDERQPACLRCEKDYNTECEGYGTKRIAFRTQKSASTSLISIPASYRSQGKSKNVEHHQSPSPCLSQFSQMPNAPNSFLNITPHEHHLLSIFTTEFAKSTAISPLQNLYLKDIAPLATRYGQVRSTLLAVSSVHTAPNQTTSALKYYADAISALRTSSIEMTYEDSQAHLASVFIMAWCDILLFDPDKWVFHLKTACTLINGNAKQMWMTSSGRRMIYAIGRLDYADSLSNRATPMLSHSVYNLLENSWYDTLNHSIEVLIDGACTRLTGVFGLVAQLSFEWTNGLENSTPNALNNQAVDVLNRLEFWKESLPEALQWKTIDNASTRYDATHQVGWMIDKSRLFKMLWLHYFAATIHVYHMLQQMGSSVQLPSRESTSIVAYQCLAIIKELDLQSTTGKSYYRGDMSISFVLAVIGVLIDNLEDRSWIYQYLTRQGREMLWCGYERACCLRAWWSSNEIPNRELIASQPVREGISWDWKPEMGMSVRILYKDCTTKSLGADWYYFEDCRPDIAEEAMQFSSLTA